MHRILTNPFYAGFLISKGVLSQGKHEPVVSIQEFEQVQTQLGRPSIDRPRGRRFAFTGLIRCGTCARAITAEQKVNRHGTSYTYYHCAGRSRLSGCPEPSIERKELEAQIRAFLDRIRVHEEIEPWIWANLASGKKEDAGRDQARKASLSSSLGQVEAQLRELTSLRLRQLIEDNEFVATRASLDEEAAQLRKKLAEPPSPEDPFEPFRTLISFSKLAADLFDGGSEEDKRLIVQTCSSNPSISGKILSISAAKPFVEAAELAACLKMRGRVDNSHTLSRETFMQVRERAKHMANVLKENEYAHILPTITLLLAHREETHREYQLELPLAA